MSRKSTQKLWQMAVAAVVLMAMGFVSGSQVLALPRFGNGKIIACDGCRQPMPLAEKIGLLHHGPLLGAPRPAPAPDDADAWAKDWHLLIHGEQPMALDVSLTLDQVRELRGKAVKISYRRIGDKSQVHVVSEIQAGITHSFEGTFGEPQIGYDDRVPGWHLTTATGEIIRLNDFSLCGARVDLQSYVGKKVRVKVKESVGFRFYESGGSHVAIDFDVFEMTVIDEQNNDDNRDDNQD